MKINIIINYELSIKNQSAKIILFLKFNIFFVILQKNIKKSAARFFCKKITDFLPFALTQEQDFLCQKILFSKKMLNKIFIYTKNRKNI